MSTVSPENQQQDAFDRLLEAMPNIASAVNAFDTKETKRLAMEALIRAIGVPMQNAQMEIGEAQADEESSPAEQDFARAGVSASREAEETLVQTTAGPRNNRTCERRKRSGSAPAPAKDYNFWPDGKQSLKAFAEEKQPRSIDHKNAVVIHWFGEVDGLDAINAGHVAAAYRAMGWKEPSDLVNALQATASRQHWLNTSNSNALKLTPGGRNLVLYDLPPAPRKRAAKKAAKKS